MKSVLSVDVEDWYHILDLPSAPPRAEWDSLPAHVETDFRRLLALFAETGVRTTCFFLGYVARRFPRLVREAQQAGHEIASHGFAHELVHRQTRREFLADIIQAREILEDLIGAPVVGYRAPGFSVTSATPWFYEALHEAGYRYSSSLFPGSHGHGGIAGAALGPHDVPVFRDTIGGASVYEFPITLSQFMGRRLCFFGGGSLRLFPGWLVRRQARQVLSEGRPVVFYIHPREINPHHPRLPCPVVRRFKCYVNLKTTETKLRRILAEFPCTTFQALLDSRLGTGDSRLGSRDCGAWVGSELESSLAPLVPSP